MPLQCFLAQLFWLAHRLTFLLSKGFYFSTEISVLPTSISCPKCLNSKPSGDQAWWPRRHIARKDNEQPHCNYMVSSGALNQNQNKTKPQTTPTACLSELLSKQERVPRDFLSSSFLCSSCPYLSPWGALRKTQRFGKLSCNKPIDLKAREQITGSYFFPKYCHPSSVIIYIALQCIMSYLTWTTHDLNSPLETGEHSYGALCWVLWTCSPQAGGRTLQPDLRNTSAYWEHAHITSFFS